MFGLLTDFNDIRDGVVRGLAEDAQGSLSLRVGDRVFLHDDGEHEAWGAVCQIQDGLVSVGIDWETWGDAGRYQLHESNDWWVAATFEIQTMKSWGRGAVRMPAGRRISLA